MGHNDTSMEEQLQRLWAEEGENVGVPQNVRRLLNSAFKKVPVSSFPKLPCGKGMYIQYVEDLFASLGSILTSMEDCAFTGSSL